MQATVASFDDDTRSGRVLTDDGVPHDFAAGCLADHVRLLRLGQRVFVELDGTAVTSLALWR